MAYKILPGVMQGTKRNGRVYLYQHAVYPNGKLIEVPYADIGAERGYTIPLPIEYKPKRQVRSGIMVEVDRVMILEFRERITQQRHKLRLPNKQGEEYVGLQLRPLMCSPDQGQTWVPVESPAVDWLNQSHEEA